MIIGLLMPARVYKNDQICQETGNEDILRASNGTFCKQDTAVGPGAHPVAARRRANGLPGLSKVLASGEFLLFRSELVSVS